MRILLSNDDGVHAEGLQAMHRALKSLGDVWVVAPLEEKSTTGHSLTLHKPLRILPMGKQVYAVTGSPADCVYLGIRQVMKAMPDFVVSGINRGANLGQDVYYSGTVSAAREACILGIPSLAVSLDVDFERLHLQPNLRYATAAKAAVQVMRALQGTKLPHHTLLNLNVPNVPTSRLKGFTFTKQGFRYYSGSILRRKDHRGRDYFWVGGRYKGFKNDQGTDCHAVEKGYASLTPLKLDSTDLHCLAAMERALHTQGRGIRRGR